VHPRNRRERRRLIGEGEIIIRKVGATAEKFNSENSGGAFDYKQRKRRGMRESPRQGRVMIGTKEKTTVYLWERRRGERPHLLPWGEKKEITKKKEQRGERKKVSELTVWGTGVSKGRTESVGTKKTSPLTECHRQWYFTTNEKGKVQKMGKGSEELNEG